MKKIIITNIILLIIVFFLLDIYVYYNHLYISHRYSIFDNISYTKHITRKLNKNYTDSIMFSPDTYIRYGGTHSPLEGSANLQNRPIFLFGCSFIEGAGLNQEENIDYLLVKNTNSLVFNRSAGGWGTQHTLYQLKNDKFYKTFEHIKNPIIVYTYIDDHKHRINRAMEPILFGGYPTFVFREKNKKLIYDNISSFIFRFPILSAIKENLYYNSSKCKDRAEFLKFHILEAKKEIDEHYKNQKTDFIVLIYKEDYEILSIIDDLINNNIKVTTYEQLTGINSNNPILQISETDTHPSRKAWELFIPKFVQYLNRLEDKQIYSEIIEYKEKQIQNFEIENYNFNADNLFHREIPIAGFSLAYLDKQEIEKNKISLFRASAAYISWCISNLLKESHIKFLSDFMLKITIKLNPYNKFYKDYKDINS